MCKKGSDGADQDDQFIGKVAISCDSKPVAIVNVDRQPVKLCIDTGANVTIIPKTYLENFNVKLLNCGSSLIGPQNEALSIAGKFSASMSVDNKASVQEIFVIDGLTQPLLGWLAIKALSVLKTIQGLTENKFVQKYSQVFNRLGTIKYQYSITLRDGAKPSCFTTPRRVPLPLQNAVKEKIKQMIDTEVITSVTECTAWCARIVVVPKKGGKVRLYVDYTHLNNSVLCKQHMLPVVDEALAKLAGAKFFFKT